MFAQSPAGARSVNGLSKPRSAFDRLVRLFCTDVAVLKGLTWRRVAYTVLVAAGFAAVDRVRNLDAGKVRMEPQAHWNCANSSSMKGGDGSLVSGSICPCSFRRCLRSRSLTICSISRVPRTVLLVVAFVLGTTVGSVVVMTSGNYATGRRPGAWCGAGSLRWSTSSAAATRSSPPRCTPPRLAQVELQKKALESHLQLMQAQVEPQFLFNTLRRVGDLYETDRSSADRMLDNLILYLRAALPQMRTSASTLGQEVQLAQAYLNIERIRASRPARFRVRCSRTSGLGDVSADGAAAADRSARAARSKCGADYDESAARRSARRRGNARSSR